MTFRMLDPDVAAVSPSTTYRVLAGADVIDRWSKTPSKKGTGFVQLLHPHEHWHVDIAYLNILGTFYYLCSVLDGASRAIVHHEIREAMREADVELVLQRAREKSPDARPRVISDNGPQFIARDFKEFIRVSGQNDFPAGRAEEIWAERDRKLEAARALRTERRAAARELAVA